MSFLYDPSTSTHSQNNFCNASLLYLSLCLHFLSKPFTLTSDTTLTCEVPGVSKLLDSIPDSGCDSVSSNFYTKLMQFLRHVPLFPLVLSLRLCGNGIISLQREQLCQMLVSALICSYHCPLDILSSNFLQVHLCFPSKYSWVLFCF